MSCAARTQSLTLSVGITAVPVIMGRFIFQIEDHPHPTHSRRQPRRIRKLMAQREYADVTPLFAEATKAMPLGKMLHGADFNMWDASTALRQLFEAIEARAFLSSIQVFSISLTAAPSAFSAPSARHRAV